MSTSDGHSIKRDKLAVLLIDMQKYFLNVIPFFRKRKMISEQIKILQICAKYDILLVIIEMNRHGEETVDVLKNETKKVPRVSAIRKENPSAFKNTKLNRYLKRRGIKNLILMGVYADECVKSTAMDAIKKHGFKIITSSGLITSYMKSDTYENWFRENGQFFDGIETLIQAIERKEKI